MIDMLSLLPEYTTDQFDSRHRLVLVAAQRAKHLIQGAKGGGAVTIYQRNHDGPR